ncbi:hypothetical protein MTO96_002717 [Rhipicephalus appendiculatus]
MVYEHGRLTIMEMVVPGLLAKVITMVVTVVVNVRAGRPDLRNVSRSRLVVGYHRRGDANATTVPLQT